MVSRSNPSRSSRTATRRSSKGRDAQSIALSSQPLFLTLPSHSPQLCRFSPLLPCHPHPLLFSGWRLFPTDARLAILSLQQHFVFSFDRLPFFRVCLCIPLSFCCCISPPLLPLGISPAVPSLSVAIRCSFAAAPPPLLSHRCIIHPRAARRFSCSSPPRPRCC